MPEQQNIANNMNTPVYTVSTNAINLVAKIAETVKRQNELQQAIDEIINDLEENNNE